MVAWVEQKYPAVDWQAETEEFVDYWIGTGKRMVDWTATWRNWMRRSVKFNRQGGAKSPTPAWATVGLDPQYGTISQYTDQKPIRMAGNQAHPAAPRLFKD